MPVKVVKKTGARPWKIIEPNGKIVGSSKTKEQAQSSANARNATRHGWKPTGKPAQNRRGK